MVDSPARVGRDSAILAQPLAEDPMSILMDVFVFVFVFVSKNPFSLCSKFKFRYRCTSD